MFPSRSNNSVLFAIILFVLLAIGIPSPVFSAATNGEAAPPSVDSKSIIQRLTLSTAEQAWLAKMPTIRVRIGTAPPLHSFEKGEAQGISVDYMRLFCEGFELQCTFITMPWSEAIENIGAGKDGDLILTIKHTADREAHIAFTSDYLLIPLVIFSRDNSPFIGGVDDLSGKTISIESGYALLGELERDYPDIKLHEAPTSKDALEALATGQVDAYIGNLTISTYLINRWGFSNVKVAAPTPFGGHNQAMGIRKDWPELVSLMDRFLAVMTPQEHSKITNRWLSVRYEYGVDWPFVLKIIGTIVGIGFLVITIILVWNRRLQMEVKRRQEAEARLCEREKDLSHAQHIAGMGSWSLDLTTNALTWSDEIYLIFGLHPQEFEATYEAFLDAVYPDDRDAVKKAVTNALELQSPYSISHRIVTPDGVKRTVQEQGEVLFDDAGAPVRMIGTVQDITERLRMEEMLRQSEKMKSITGLAAGMAHELNNPLGGMLQNVQNVSRRLSPELPKNKEIAHELDIEIGQLAAYMEKRKIPALIESISESGQQASEIIKSLISLSQKEGKRKAHINLSDLINNAISLAKVDFDLKHTYYFGDIDIVREFASTLPTVFCQADDMESVILTVLRNAAQAMLNQKRPPQISVRTKQRDRFAVIEIEDNGPGMPPEVLNRIFDPLYTTASPQRKGLGLSTAFSIVCDSHDGQLRAESELGKGTKIIIELPIDKDRQ
ncbi:PAS domain-containing protein [Pseudomonadota bacterium]